MEKKADLAIILPMYNPEINWTKKLTNSIIILKSIFKNYNIKIVVVNDGSDVDIVNKIKMLQINCDCIKYIHNNINLGKGYAIKTGIKNISAKYYIYSDWDFPFGEKILYNFFKLQNENKFDLILSKRNKSYFKILPKERLFISKFLIFISFFIFHLNLYDAQAGLKAVNENGKNLLLKTKINSFIFEVEFIQSAIKKKLRIMEIEVAPKSNIEFSNFGLKTLKLEIKNLVRLFFCD